MVKTHIWDVIINALPTIVVFGSDHDFGSVPWKADGTNCGVEYGYLVTNTSTTAALVTISTPSVSGYFSCSLTGGGTCGVETTILPGGTRTVHVNFCPQAVGYQVGVMRVVCSNCSPTTIERNIYGTGINTTIADLNPEPQSTYSSGPYIPGQTTVNVASLSIKNIGNYTGKLSWQCYAHANQGSQQTLLTEGTTTNNYAPGSSVQQPQIVTIPNETGTIPFGVKVKGETESTWPAWGQLGATIWNEGLDIDYGMIIGGVAAASIFGGLLYIIFKEK